MGLIFFFFFFFLGGGGSSVCMTWVRYDIVREEIERWGGLMGVEQDWLLYWCVTKLILHLTFMFSKKVRGKKGMHSATGNH